MRDYNFSFGKDKKELDERVAAITRCYILLHYGYNTDDENKLYREEFKKRYVAFYRAVNEKSEYLDERHMSGIVEEIKELILLPHYQTTMSFLDGVELGEPEEFNSQIEEDYEKKTLTETVKRNFFHNNNCEFGTKTRDHVNLTQCGVIDPMANDDTEDAFIFAALTTYFRNTYSTKKTGDAKHLVLTSA